MDVVVTGAAGYIGSHVCRELLNQGFGVIGIDDLSTGDCNFLDSRVNFYEGKVQDIDFLNKVFATFSSNTEIGVIHCAGLKFAGESVKFPLHYYENNTLAVQTLLSAMHSYSIRLLVFSSSCSIYGNIETLKPVEETFTLNPVSPYGRSKLFAEGIIKDAITAGLIRATALRYFNVAGNSDSIGHDISPFNLFPNLYRAISEKKSFTVFGGDFNTPDGSCIRDYVDVSLLAKAHVTSLNKLIRGEELEFAYNLGSGVGASVYQILQVAKEEIDEGLKFVTTSARPGDPAQILSNNSLAVRDLEWSHSVSLREMVLSGWDAWNSYKK